LKVRIGVVADDLTGACDTGIQFKKYGLETFVLISPYHSRGFSENTEAMVLDTESRNDPPEVAYKKVRKATGTLKDAQTEFFYKKVDSTLRGNIGRELDAMLDVSGAEAAIVAPAFPENGRITVGGYQLVEGVPLGMMESGGHEKEPGESHIPTILQKQTKRKVGYITLFKVAAGLEALETEIRNRIQAGEEVIVVDAVADSDLKAIAHVISLGKHPLVACGSAGLAKGMAGIIGITARKPVLIIAGSINSVTIRQVIRTAERPNSLLVEVQTRELLKSKQAAEAEIVRVTDEVLMNLGSGIDVIVTSARSRASVEKALIIGELMGFDEAKIREIISIGLGELAKRVSEKEKFAGLVLTGGDVAMSVLKSMGIRRLRLEKEILPGIPLTTTTGGEYDGLKIVTKAGGFGGENALLEIVQQLKGA